jgi:YbgC/YbaW family acyl-CoA thioester hydrolase
MSALFTQRLRVRAYECDSLGHVNNSVYLQYLQQLTLDAHGWRDDADALPIPRALSVEYQTPARYGDELDISTWLARADNSSIARGYEIARGRDGAKVLLAQIVWEMPRGAATEFVAERPLPLKTFVVPRGNGARPWFWKHQVARYEVDVSQGAQLAAYFHWLEEATFRTAHLSGWTMERLRAENFVTLQYRHDAEFFEPARNRDEIEIVSRLFEVRRVRATWIHEMRRVRDGALLLRDYSTGAFLDWAGNIRAAPAGMMEQLTQGESA